MILKHRDTGSVVDAIQFTDPAEMIRWLKNHNSAATYKWKIRRGENPTFSISYIEKVLVTKDIPFNYYLAYYVNRANSYFRMSPEFADTCWIPQFEKPEKRNLWGWVHIDI
jgi:hypothetical protein